MKSSQNQWIKGFTVGFRIGEEISVSHLLFADDTLIFCESQFAN